MILRRLLWAALAVALVVGSIQSVVHNLGAVPIIQAAEVFEDQKREIAPPAQPHLSDSTHSHGPEWKPADGFERQAWSWVANVNFSFALALLVLVILGFRERSLGLPENQLRLGLIIAVCGFMSMYLWPALGLPPEIPGMDAPVLGARQAWWLLAAGSAAAACSALAFSTGPSRWIVAPALFALPFVIGAPQQVGDPFSGFSEPAAQQLRLLAERFVWTSAVTSLIQWLLLGAACSLSFRRWLQPLLRESVDSPRTA